MRQITKNVFVTIQKRTQTSDTQGQMIETWSNKHVAIPGRLDQPAGKAQASMDSILYHAEYALFISARFAYLDTAEYRIVIGSRNYKILGINNPGGQGTHAELLLQWAR